MIKEPTANAHWRDSARSPRLFFIDAQAAIPLLGFLLHITTWTFILAIIVMLFFSFLSHFGYSIAVFQRIMRNFFAGPRKMAQVWWKN